MILGVKKWENYCFFFLIKHIAILFYWSVVVLQCMLCLLYSNVNQLYASIYPILFGFPSPAV